MSLLDVLSVQNIFLWDDTQSNSAYSHNDLSISLTYHYFGNGTFFMIFADMPIFNLLSQTRNAYYLMLSFSSLKSVNQYVLKFTLKIPLMTLGSLFPVATRTTLVLMLKWKQADLPNSPTLYAPSALFPFHFPEITSANYYSGLRKVKSACLSIRSKASLNDTLRFWKTNMTLVGRKIFERH